MSILVLEQFFPYQLTHLQALVTDNIAQIYTGQFDLSPQQWRVLAVLGNNELLTAKEISVRANLEKMPTSRAISGLLTQKLLVKSVHDGDKRCSLLNLTKKGQDLYQQLVPLALKREQELLSVLNEKEQAQIQLIFKKLAKQAKQLKSN
ncbi:MarR family winged helix-turn-helix transcriptional regulator [Thalassotalea piscium]|uniref:DNA-binding MarR family transcriptional regulator n=1 Tax=Thalassotalea piscium TaxID=1230533 RepID=A0A7X0NDU9_9GAMM|nr:MarR family transcriptional regulator [Thalassotalea piscium]MBB6541629.1 DNA-binding MarR family transcriptional regulator [Thalassotalea piscium]